MFFLKFVLQLMTIQDANNKTSSNLYGVQLPQGAYVKERTYFWNGLLH